MTTAERWAQVVREVNADEDWRSRDEIPVDPSLLADMIEAHEVNA